MNKDLKSGRYLDSLVADKVMGLDIKKSVPNYSNSISDAWEIVEHLSSSGIDNLRLLADTRQGIEWYVEFCDKSKGAWSAFAETAPHAICLAALKTVGYFKDISISK